ncbi:MAG: inorganic diphosphatase [bacterium]|nr:inorganic diphosphatase [bacterium]
MEPTATYATQYLNKEVQVTIDRQKDSKHQKHGFVYELNYGFVPDTKAPDGEEVDAYVIGVNEPITEFKGVCIAVIHRLNDDDDKLVVVPRDTTLTDEEIRTKTNFQEQYFKSEIIRL